MQRQMLKSKIHRATIGALDSDPTVLLGGISPNQGELQ